MYSFKQLAQQSPEKIKVTLLAVAGVAIALFTNADPTLLETVGAGIAIERLLDLFYVAPVNKAKEEAVWQAVDELATTKALEGIELGKQLARVRPLPAA